MNPESQKIENKIYVDEHEEKDTGNIIVSRHKYINKDFNSIRIDFSLSLIYKEKGDKKQQEKAKRYSIAYDFADKKWKYSKHNTLNPVGDKKKDVVLVENASINDIRNLTMGEDKENLKFIKDFLDKYFPPNKMSGGSRRKTTRRKRRLTNRSSKKSKRRVSRTKRLIKK